MTEPIASERPPETDQEEPAPGSTKSNAWTDLALVVPVFLGYHLGVGTMDVRNAADVVTATLIELVDRSMALYWGLTVALGLAVVAVLTIIGRGQAFDVKRLGMVIVEGVLYAFVMGAAASYIVGSLPLGGSGYGALDGTVMSLGAGLYEEIAFRAGLFGLGSLALRAVVSSPTKQLVLIATWALVAAAAFSGWHYVGSLGDDFELRSFVFRWVCGVLFTVIFIFRGFAPVVWTHVLYDVYVLVLM